jgi:hypothetical protein
MKTLSLLVFAVSAVADVTSLSARPRGPHPVGLHSQYAVVGSEEIINILVPYHDSDTVQTFMISTNYTPTVHYRRIDDRSLVERDICAYITDCAGNAYSTTTAWAAAAKQLTVKSCNGVANAVNSYLSDGVCLLSSFSLVLLASIIRRCARFHPTRTSLGTPLSRTQDADVVI